MHSPPCNRHHTSPASHRRPPAFIGPRRAKESCGVGAFSLNYGPQSTRGKCPYVSDPRLSRAVPTPRDPYSPAPTPLCLSDNRAAKLSYSQVSTASRVTSSSFRTSLVPWFRSGVLLTRVAIDRQIAVSSTVASCNGARESHDSSPLAVFCDSRPLVVLLDPRMRRPVTRGEPNARASCATGEVDATHRHSCRYSTTEIRPSAAG